MASSMLRGYLNVLVLKALGDRPMSGYGLMRFVRERIGTRPSPGSIYPLLERLRNEGIVSAKGVGNSKQYRLTQKGRKRLRLVEQKRTECLDSFVSGMRMLSALTGENMEFPEAMVEGMRSGTLPFREINPEWDELHTLVFRLMQQDGLVSKAKAVRMILGSANRALRAL